MKRALCPALFLLLAAAAVAAHANPAPTPSQFLRSLAAPACAAVAPGSALEGAIPATLGGACLARHCSDDEECACSEALSYACVGGACQYTYSGGTGGGGGLGCPGAHCTDDAQCQANCPAGPNSYCATNFTCVYVP